LADQIGGEVKEVGGARGARRIHFNSEKKARLYSVGAYRTFAEVFSLTYPGRTGQKRK